MRSTPQELLQRVEMKRRDLQRRLGGLQQAVVAQLAEAEARVRQAGRGGGGGGGRSGAQMAKLLQAISAA